MLKHFRPVLALAAIVGAPSPARVLPSGFRIGIDRRGTQMIAFARRVAATAALVALVGCGAACGGGGGGGAVGNVYVVGFEERPTGWVAMLWKDGVAVPLDDRHPSSATAVALQGNDVYVAGSVRYGPMSEAVYWKNGAPVRLSDGTRDAWASAIAVSGGSVYVVGVDDGVAMLWKDGVATPLTSGLRAAYAQAVAVTAEGVWVGGQENEPVEVSPGTFEMTTVAKCWEDGVTHPLTDGSVALFATVTGVVASGGHVYASGVVEQAAGAYALPTLWTDGVPQTLPVPGTLASADAVAVNGADVLVGGALGNGTSDVATLWTNGLPSPLPHQTSSSRVAALATGGGAVYAAGMDGNVAMVWVNGQAQPLTDGTYAALGQGIAVR